MTMAARRYSTVNAYASAIESSFVVLLAKDPRAAETLLIRLQRKTHETRMECSK